MKNLIISMVGILLIYLLALCSIVSCKRELAHTKIPGENSRKENSIRVYSTPELSELTAKWAKEYCLLNPEARIKVMNVSESFINEKFESSNNLVFLTGELDTTTYKKSYWQEVVGRDAIIPVVNSSNPIIDEIMMQGISVEMLAQMINTPGMRDWGMLLKTNQDIPFNLYMTTEVSTNSRLIKFLGVDQLNIDGIKVGAGKNLLASIESDPYGIGICKIKNIIDFNSNSILENIKVLPLDRNNDGRIDHAENIYDNLDVLLRGVWIGKYPRVLTRNIYSVSPLKPTNKTEVEFLKWVLSDGQQYLNDYGFIDLWHTERLAKVKLIDDYKMDMAAVNSYSLTKRSLFYLVYLPILVILSFALVVLVVKGIEYVKKLRTSRKEISFKPKFLFNEVYVDSPQGLYYDKTHTWAFMEKNGIVTMGIDDFLQHTTGSITGIKMKHPGERVKRSKKVVSIIQAGKQLDIYAPFSGTIVEHNTDLIPHASILNSSPYNDGWIYKIEPTNWLKEMQFLIKGGQKYKEWLKDEFIRLKEFFENSIKSEKVEYAHVLQDGGELKDGILMDFGPEVWEDFQTSFIDVSS